MMALVQNTRPHPEKDHTLLRVPVKRLMRERPIEAAPIKKRVMAALNLSCKKTSEWPLSSSRTPVIKTEHVEKDAEFFKYQHVSKGQDGRDSALDLSPALRHTLAQFTLSSQCSLGGPAAFSGQYSQEKQTPSLSQASVAVGPLLVPPDSSTELVLCTLEGESISCFSVGGELRLCLPQVLNTVLRDFSLQQINSVCDQLYVYCSRCNASQLHVLKVLGVLPAGAPSCGLITLTDAQRLCNTLLHPGDNLPAGPHRDPRLAEEEEREAEETGGFWVEHQCLGKCNGLFVPRLYAAPGAPCIRCSQCRRLFCPERFVMHSHRQPEKRTCHWGFDSGKWACYLQLGRRYQGSADEGKLEQLLEAMKLKFSGICLDTKTSHLESARVEEGLSLCSGKVKVCESGSEGKMGAESAFPAYVFDPCVLTNLKEDPRHLDLMWQSWYLYMHDKLSVSGASLDSTRATDKGDAAPRAETLKPAKKAWEEAQESERKASSGGKKTSRPASQSQRGDPDQRPRVSIETPACEKSLQENKDSMVVEVLQMYNVQQEKLQSTLCKQQQMEKELQALRKADADEQTELQALRKADADEQTELRALRKADADEQTELRALRKADADEQTELRALRKADADEQTELQALRKADADEQTELQALRKADADEQMELQTEHAQQKEVEQEELKRLKCSVEQQQRCRCREQQENRYAAQLLELRQRLDRAEEDREELQEELRREREAREKLERIISELRQQIKESVPSSALDSPLSNSSGDVLMSPAP